MVTSTEPYAARLDVDYPDDLDRFTTFVRVIWVIPIVIILSLLTATGNETVVTETGDEVRRTGGGISGGLALATALMLVFRRRYPRWWFDFARELTRFGARVGAYFVLLTDRYPSTVDEQSVHVEIDYPDAEQDLNRWLPLVKWPAGRSRITLCSLCLEWWRSLQFSLPGSPYSSRGGTRAVCSTMWWELADGGCGSALTLSCWSPTAIHLSASSDPGPRDRDPTRPKGALFGRRLGDQERHHCPEVGAHVFDLLMLLSVPG